MATTCKVCSALNIDDIEAAGLRALSGELSWRAVGREVDMTNYASIKNHMENHYVAAVARAVDDDMQRYIEEAVTELKAQFAISPPEVKPLILAAIHNVRELRNTKPSQQHLIQSLKTIQEMTGMKQEQRMMLLFAEKMFGEVPSPAPKAELPDPNIIDVEAVEVPLPVDDEPVLASTISERG